MASGDSFAIEVIYIDTEKSFKKSITVKENTSINEAIQLSGILEDCPSISLMENKVGMFGKIMELDKPLKKGDRVEIYRPLKVDPKESRRRRAKIKSQKN